MDLDWIDDFLVLAEQRNFSKAAALRHVSQPAFSRRIRALEAWIGTPLFERGAQTSDPTRAGRHFLPLANEIMRNLHRARRDTRAVGAFDTQALSIAATHALSFTFFPAWMRANLGDAAGAVTLVSDSLDACERIMLAGEAHFLLCHHRDGIGTRLAPPRFESLRVGTDRLVPLCKPDKAGRPTWTIGAGRKPVPLLGYSAASSLGRILAGHDMTQITGAAPVFLSHLAATLLTMARDGHGVGWIPLSLAADDLAHGRLVRAGAPRHDHAIDIRLVRSPNCRNEAADRLWVRLMSA